MIQSLKEAVQEYITSRTIVSPYDLVNDLLPKYYPVSDIVLDAAKYFTTIIKNKDMCVPQDMLKKYNVLGSKDLDTIRSADVSRMLKQYNLIEGRDYLLRNVAQQSSTSRGTKYTKQYTLTPKAFFICLVRSKNSYEYAEYYFHTLEIYDYYEEYFTSMYKSEIEFFL